MTAQHWLLGMLATTAVIYAATALAYHFSLRPGMMLVFVGYAVANVGLIWDAAGK